jgi:GT2 family glycosyltransferase
MPTPLAKPWLSVIMPTHHGEDWVDASLGSLVEHGAEGIEILVLDSSATGDTLAKVEAFADRLCIRVLDPADRTMWHAKTNLGVQEARADHVCWLHQDDLWLPGRSAAVRRWIDADPGAGLHLANSLIVDRAGRSMGQWSCPLDGEGPVPSDLLLERLLVQNFIAAPVPVYRRDIYLAVGGLDETLWYTADWDLWLKLQAAGTVCFHPEVTAAFRIHGSSLTVSGSRDASDFRDQMEIVLDRHLPRLTQRNKSVRLASRASLEVNTALAAASAGNLSELRSAARALLSLRPSDWVRFLRDSRLFDRLVPRLRARFAGDF